MNVEEPLPCPFCGNEVKSQSFWWHGCAPGNGPRGYYVFCLECSETDALDGPRRDTFEDAIAAWNRRTPPAMSADHIGEATNMVAPVKAMAWQDIATAPRDGTMLLVGYDEGVAREGAMEDRQRVFEARWNDVQGTWSARNGFLLHSDATHWQPLPPPPSAHPAPINPSGDTGELRERVAQIIEAAIERHNPGNSLRHTIDDADAILDLIQSERAG